ncbi:carboxymuconolactone decarboxylase family protein [Nocardia sp. NBC_01503]|uniref:carboxymuconolactone decarboxylase family protein n=1 Tax=Nocardia sp. NBC_01503 TaxID=2975997 RepID=UPI002E7C312D|nr:carboxymuconolactone decarboxylase family protein [Nocardia sp. NBC_01503]WTL32510.1 carboxymuconolactone decarboxylase family protein [Nocardia sp. NBC_01503]
MNSTPATSETRYERGLAVLDQVGGPSGRAVVNSLADIAPDLGRYVVEFGYGDIYGRPGLTLRQRQIITIASLTALGHAAPQLRWHIDGGLNVGLTPAEVVETIIQVGVYAGFPAALNGLTVARAAFADRPEVGNPVLHADIRSDETGAERYQRGLAKFKEVDGDNAEHIFAALADTAPDMGRYIIEFAFADVYSRPGLGLAERELATIAACTTLGTAGPQLRVHLHGFLNVGGTRDEAVEAIIQLGGYAGFPAALNAITAAREVFAARE